MIANDGDMDISVAFEDLNRILQLKEYLYQQFGFLVYQQFDTIRIFPELKRCEACDSYYHNKLKLLFPTFNKTSEPVIFNSCKNKDPLCGPCLRVVENISLHRHVDIYCDHRVSEEKMLQINQYPQYALPSVTNKDAMYLCSYEWTLRSNCIEEGVIRPLKTMYLKQINRTVKVPRDIDTFLDLNYNHKGGWRQPFEHHLAAQACLDRVHARAGNNFTVELARAKA